MKRPRDRMRSRRDRAGDDRDLGLPVPLGPQVVAIALCEGAFRFTKAALQVSERLHDLSRVVMQLSGDSMQLLLD